MASLTARMALKQAASLGRRAQLRVEHEGRLRALFQRLLTTEVAAIRAQLGRAETEEDWGILQAWIDEFYPEHSETVVRETRGPLLAFGRPVVDAASREVDGDPAEVDVEGFTDEYLAQFAERWQRDSIAPVRAAIRDLEGEEREERLRGEVDGWEEGRADWTAQREATQAGAAFAVAAYGAFGGGRLVWRANPGACEFCTQMEGRTVRMGGAFLGAGDGIGEEGSESGRLVTERSIGHPPLHGMRGWGGVCQCLVAAG